MRLKILISLGLLLGGGDLLDIQKPSQDPNQSQRDLLSSSFEPDSTEAISRVSSSMLSLWEDYPKLSTEMSEVVGVMNVPNSIHSQSERD